MAMGDKYWDNIKGEWMMGNPPAHQHPGVTADLKETSYNDDGSWAAAYRKINEDTNKENVVVGSPPYITLKVRENNTKTETYPAGWGAGGSEPYITNTYKQIDYKYNEAKSLGELKAYIDATYDQHYSQNQFQATEFIIDGGHGTGFCIGNVLKYAQRYGRKGTPDDWRKDLMKVIHYAVIQLHVHDLENSNGDKK